MVEEEKEDNLIITVLVKKGDRLYTGVKWVKQPYGARRCWKIKFESGLIMTTTDPVTVFQVPYETYKYDKEKVKAELDKEL